MYKITLIFLAFVCLSAWAQPKSTAVKRKPVKTGSIAFKSIESEGKTEQELKNIIKGYNLLLKETEEGSQKQKIQISQISSYLGLAKIYRLKNPQTEKQKKIELQYTEAALKLAKKVIANEKVSNKQKSYALYLSGLANINLNNTNEARDNFVYSITLDPESEIAPIISLFIGQVYFDEENYDFAIKYYNKFFAKLNNSQKALALYKIAWSYFNQEKMTDAERIFIRLAKQKKKAPLQEDALKDLAYLLTLQRKEQEIIDFAAATFPSLPTTQIELLEQVFISFQLQSGNQKKPLILNKIMESNISSDRKLKILIANLKGVQKGYASKESMDEFERVQSFMKANKITKTSEDFKTFSPELEVEVIALIKSFGETFSEKTRSPENLSPAYISRQFGSLLLFHIDHFPESEQIESSIELLVTLYTKNKNHKNLYTVSHWILKKNFPDKIKKMAEANLILSLDELEKKDPKFRPELKALLASSVKDSSNKNWIVIAKRYSKILTDDKEFDKALPLLDKINSTENSEESHYRLQWVRFELGQYDVVIKDKKEIKDPKLAQETSNILRESYLKVAAANTKDGDFAKYEESILNFLSSNPDKDKKVIAVRDYLKKLIERKDFEKVLTFSLTLPADIRFQSETLPLYKRATSQLMIQGKFKTILDFLNKDQKPGQHKEFDLDFTLCWIALDPTMDKNQLLFIKKQPPATRKYILSLWSFFNTPQLQEYIRTLGAQNKDEQQILLFSYQVDQGTIEPDLLPWVKATVKEILPAYLQKDVKETEVERLARTIKFPTPKMNADQMNKAIQKAVEQTRELRPKVVAEITNNSDKVKTRVLSKVVELEKKISDTILSSPIPDQLDEEKKAEYKQQIEALAKEFTDQAAEYDKILAKLNSTPYVTTLSESDIKSWKWNSNAQKFNDSLAGLSPIQVQVALDRALELETIQSSEYYDIKMRNILLNKRNPPIFDALTTDLNNAKQTDLAKRLSKGE